jgi:hypothetical protein
MALSTLFAAENKEKKADDVIFNNLSSKVEFHVEGG